MAPRNPDHDPVGVNSAAPAEAWKRFENEVTALLAAQGWHVDRETLIGHKKIDAFAWKLSEFGRRRRLAVECKHYDRALTERQVSSIYADYLPLIQQNLVDEILIVTVEDLTPTARAYCNGLRDCTHLTRTDLLNSILDFRAYLEQLLRIETSDPFAALYVPQDYKDEAGNVFTSLEDFLLRWVNTDDSRPIAVLGGYGMGKTTLARRLANILAARHLRDTANRIPVYLALETMISEPSLEGLLAKRFTAALVVGNYNVDTFLRLNESGRFVVLLDGFDDMCQLSGWSFFQYGFDQLSRLVNSQSKVILFGRPETFLTEAEYEEVLHGRRRILGRARALAGAVDYRILELLPFSARQIGALIRQHVSDLGRAGRSTRGLRWYLRRIERHGDAAPLVEIIRRPVQLRMFLEIRESYAGAMGAATTTALYSEFIDLVIRREARKRARVKLGMEQRRGFASDLALWMWRALKGTSVAVAEVPDGLFEVYAKPGEDLEAVKRDLIGACFLEVRGGEKLAFGHATFQEYLVAERLSEWVRGGSEPDVEAVRLSPEVVTFFVDHLVKRDVQQWKARVEKRGAERMSAAWLELFLAACKRHGIHIPQGVMSRRRLKGTASGSGH